MDARTFRVGDWGVGVWGWGLGGWGGGLGMDARAVSCTSGGGR